MVYKCIAGEKIWIGIDDTDSLKGGCTTYLALTLIKKITDMNYDLIGYPRLVRLNPNIPWKTRGNGAVSFQIGEGEGKKKKIGEVENKELFFYRGCKNLFCDKKEIANVIEESIYELGMLDDRNTNPGFVLTDKKPPFEIYIRTVREIVKLYEIKNILNSLNAYYKGYNNQRGIIGATASVAWDNRIDRTFELLCYREKSRWGTKRFVDDESTKEMDNIFTSTFDNFDYRNKHNRLVPNSPCPVLFGIRGEDDDDLVKAKSIIKSEKIDCWLIFETNQGTDDHLQRKNIDEIKPYDSVIVKGEVYKTPRTIKGGHVIFGIRDETGSIDCAAYEPTKEFRNVVRKLMVGDVIEVYGGVRKKPLTINLEKIKIESLAKKISKLENPICPNCGKHMKSKGKDKGFKCVRCGKKEDRPILKEENRDLALGWYEVPVCARRHLSKPLKRIK